MRRRSDWSVFIFCFVDADRISPLRNGQFRRASDKRFPAPASNVHSAMHRLLVLACSQRKSAAGGRVPAIDRYDGPAFRVLRKFLRESRDDSLSVLILSAKHGLIDAAEPIQGYDLRMTPRRGSELRPQVYGALGRAIRKRQWRAIAVCAGKDYSAALGDMASVAPAGVPVEVLKGGLGRRLTHLREWLHAGRSIPTAS